jgi:type IV pilus assembly protein PilX
MLAHRFPGKRFAHPAKERGVVLMISLIILVALTIAGIALIRSVDTTNIISGNLAFQQAAVHAAEAGTEEAVRTFLETSTPIALQNDDLAKGYVASTPASGNPASWDTYWSATINPNPVGMPVAAKTCVDRVCTLATDAAGNTVSYTIQRLCQTTGDPSLSPTGCASDAQQAALSGASLGSGSVQLNQVPKYYYRITSRVAGPRNTLSYVQTIVAR